MVPNLFPAFGDWPAAAQEDGVYTRRPARGRQEVVVHTPRHVRSLAELSRDEHALVARTWQERAATARGDGFAYVHAFVNEGRPAGASLPHSHSQLLWLEDEPPIPAQEALRDAGSCPLCRLVAEERESEARVVGEREGLILFCPFAGRLPYELCIAPLDHTGDAFTDERLGTALSLLAEGLARVYAVEGTRAANAWLHTAPLGEGSGHWHLEVLPRLSIFAGLELGAGLYVNPLPPETAARALRAAPTRAAL